MGSQPNKIRAEDIDGDGFSDLVTANTVSRDVSVLLNQGQGTFSPQVRVVVGDGPLFLVVDDVNGDLVPDVVTGNVGAGDLSRTATLLLSNP